MREKQRERKKKKKKRIWGNFLAPFTRRLTLPPLVLRSRPPAGCWRLLHDEMRLENPYTLRPPSMLPPLSLSLSLSRPDELSRCTDLRSSMSSWKLAGKPPVCFGQFSAFHSYFSSSHNFYLKRIKMRFYDSTITLKLDICIKFTRNGNHAKISFLGCRSWMH